MPNATDIKWFKEQFDEEIRAQLSGTPFDLDMIVAIACQETGYIWSVLRRKPLAKAQIVALCVGDAIDASGGRSEFPKTKAELIAKPNGQQMFTIARKALVDMAQHVPGYAGAVAKPNKFCHGFGPFQRDLQFFLEDSEYFLQRRYESFEESLRQCLGELKRGLRQLRFQNKPLLTDLEFAYVAIAYNTGGFKPAKGLKQGHFNGAQYYGEEIYRFVRLSRTVTVGAEPAPADAIAGSPPARYVVVARSGLNLRKGPGLDFGITRTIDTGTELLVLAIDGKNHDWARVDLEDDGLVDGHLFLPFLKPIGIAEPAENMLEPSEG